MSDIDDLRDGFYKTTVAQRNAAWKEVEALQQEKAALEERVSRFADVLTKEREAREQAERERDALVDYASKCDIETERAEATTRRLEDQLARYQILNGEVVGPKERSIIEQQQEENRRLREALACPECGSTVVECDRCAARWDNALAGTPEGPS